MKPALFANRSNLLDTIRAIAVTMVVLFHVATRYPVADLDLVARQFLRYGFLGVDIFYPLSGFLITRFLLGHSERGSIKAFFLRRLFRIVPLYAVAVTIFFFAATVMQYEAESLDKIWVTYLFLTGWFAFFTGPDSIPYTITWSLSVEEFAYILFGLSAFLLRRSFPAILVCLAIAPFVLRVYLYAEGYENIYYFPLARLDSIASGGLVAVLIGRVRHLWALLAAGTVASMLVWKAGGPVGSAALFTTVTLATCTTIAACETVLSALRGRILDAAARVGLYSYFIYLFHFFFLYALFMVVGKLGIAMPSFWIMGLLCMATTYVAAWISFTWFEAPLMQFGRRLERGAPSRPVIAEGQKP
ncbi:acyltransferase family protein [Defluviimonas sp. SAOS-178_SWC]|uniref:acyltransferase family protein n=1 Tax=Defluviimonas sp. SAOS-178_SWC TaxID=3121287 RepID=UPI0032218CCE